VTISFSRTTLLHAVSQSVNQKDADRWTDGQTDRQTDSLS